MKKEIEELLLEEVLKLTEICGIKKLTAAIIYTETKGNLTTKAAFANYCAVAPIEKSSGKTNKHCTNHRGNRKLNSIIFRLTLCQSIHDKQGKTYFERKLKEGKTKRHWRIYIKTSMLKIELMLWLLDLYTVLNVEILNDINSKFKYQIKNIS